jgi:TPP-dependent pyruvate/acetoin dehydrogenase alpha subunit
MITTTGTKAAQAARVAGKNGFSLISDEKFRELYAALLQCRMLDQRLRTGRGYERWIGREACTAGVIACLRSGDSVTPSPRGLLAGYLQGGSLMLARARASAVSAHLAAATGDGLRHKLERQGNAAVVFAGVGDPDRMREIFAAAAYSSLPVLYVLENGQPLAEICEGLPVIRVDSADAVAVYRVAHESITRAREGGGPTIIECAVWQDKGATQDSLARLEHYLSGKKLFRQNWKLRLEKKYGKVLDEAVKAGEMN